MAGPTIAQKSPYMIEVEAGKTYHWCVCGNSKKQPFWGGSHKGSEFKPFSYIPAQPKKVAMCGCKHTNNQPLCDANHKRL